MLYALEREWWSVHALSGAAPALVLPARRPAPARRLASPEGHRRRRRGGVRQRIRPRAAPLGHERARVRAIRCARTAATPYGPFHDVGAMVEGACALALGRAVPRALAPRDRRARVARASLATMRRARGRTASSPISTTCRRRHCAHRAAIRGRGRQSPRSAQLHLDAIARARRFIFVREPVLHLDASSPTRWRSVCAEPDAPEIVLLMPSTESGWLEDVDHGRAARPRRSAALRAADARGRYRMYCPSPWLRREADVHQRSQQGADRGRRAPDPRLGEPRQSLAVPRHRMQHRDRSARRAAQCAKRSRACARGCWASISASSRRPVLRKRDERGSFDRDDRGAARQIRARH